jgi:hypothetical protein
LIDDNSKELVQVNLRCTEEELLLQENSPSEDASLEENLEKEDDLFIPRMGCSHCVSYKTTCNSIKLLKLQVINMKRWLMLFRNSTTFLDKSTLSKKAEM